MFSLSYLGDILVLQRNREKISYHKLPVRFMMKVALKLDI